MECFTNDMSGEGELTNYCSSKASGVNDFHLNYTVSNITLTTSADINGSSSSGYSFSPLPDWRLSTDMLQSRPAFSGKGNTLVDIAYLEGSLDLALDMYDRDPVTILDNYTGLVPNGTRTQAIVLLKPQAEAIECNVQVVAQGMKATFESGTLHEVTVGPPIENNSAVAFQNYNDQDTQQCIRFDVPQPHPALYACHGWSFAAALNNISSISTSLSADSQLWDLLNLNDGFFCRTTP